MYTPYSTRVLNGLGLVSLFLLPSFAEELSNSTVPSQCMSICAPIVELTSICDVDPMSGMSGMSTSMPMSMPMTKTTDMSMASAATGMPMTMTTSMVMSGTEGSEAMAEMAKDQDGAIMMNAGGKKRRQMEMEMDMDMDMDMDTSTGMNEDMEEMMEASCICENKSFKVSEVMGLCASCMEMNKKGGSMSGIEDINRIMSQCSFTSTAYAPSATSVLAGLQVSATKPTMTGTTMETSMPGSAGRIGAAAGVFSVGMLATCIASGLGLLLGMM